MKDNFNNNDFGEYLLGMTVGFVLFLIWYFVYEPENKLAFEHKRRTKKDKMIDSVYRKAFYDLENSQEAVFDAERKKILDSIDQEADRIVDSLVFKRDSCFKLVEFYNNKMKAIKDSIDYSLKVANDTLKMDSVYNALNIENDMLKKDSVFNAMRKESDTTKLGEQLRKCVRNYNNTLYRAEMYHLDADSVRYASLKEWLDVFDKQQYKRDYPESLLFKSDEYRSQKIKELVLRRARFKRSLKNNEKKGR